uniref:Uncharacterized protein n=1 Tax=Pipistrellus kuhlii TaxID=59472 RepID=A0A7J7Y962_PIPKU|nr:hypothetical protein mPipKuh1_010299 [Pipistrellus kuhlii]
MDNTNTKQFHCSDSVSEDNVSRSLIPQRRAGRPQARPRPSDPPTLDLLCTLTHPRLQALLGGIAVTQDTCGWWACGHAPSSSYPCPVSPPKAPSPPNRTRQQEWRHPHGSFGMWMPVGSLGESRVVGAEALWAAPTPGGLTSCWMERGRRQKDRQ